MNKKKLLFIINPISGGKNKKGISKLIQSNLDAAKFEYEIANTKYKNHAQQIVDDRSVNFDAVVAVGGDGTINEIAKSLSTTNVPMGVIPQGSGNGLARHLKIPIDVVKAIKLLNEFHIKSIDTATLNGHFFVSIAGIGFDSLIASEFERINGRGFINYVRLSIQHFFSYKDEAYQLIIDGKKVNRMAAIVSFANSNQFGFNTKISPKADLSDGFIDVCIMRKPKLIQIPLILKQVWTAQADKSTLLEIIKAKHILIEPNNNGFANIDGESIEVGKKVEVVVHPNQLKMIVPIKFLSDG